MLAVFLRALRRQAHRGRRTARLAATSGGTFSGRCLEKATLSRIAQNSGSNLTSLEEFLSGVLNVRCGQMLEFVLEGLPNCRRMDSTKPVRQASPACS